MDFNYKLISLKQINFSQFNLIFKAFRKPNFRIKLQSLQPFLKHKWGELMRYLGPLGILQTHKTIRNGIVSKPGILPTT